MEFLRFGSSIPGSYWGCCAFDIIQNFNVDPDQKASIELVSGDGGYPVQNEKSERLFAGPTYRDIFLQRIRSGTFDKRDMPNHGFLAVLTDNQLAGAAGKKWLAILKETGFEFIRSVSNSVYGGQNLYNGNGEGAGAHRNHLFGLFRNIGAGAIGNPLLPPKAWTDLPSASPEAWEFIARFGDDVPAFANEQREAQRAIWNRIGPPKFLTEEEVIKAGAPVILAGIRSPYPQQEKSIREAKQKVVEAAKAVVKPAEKPLSEVVASGACGVAGAAAA